MKKKGDWRPDRTREVKGNERELYDYWQELYDSTEEHMSKGAQKLYKIITQPRGDNWRRKEEKKSES